MSIPLDELEPRRVYRLQARNLTMGVWTGTEWIGIREKFDNLFLDDCEVPGETAHAVERLGMIPAGMEMKCVMPTICSKCKRAVEWIQDDEPARTGVWFHTNRNTRCKKPAPVALPYEPLFDFLTDMGGVP